MSLKAIIMSQQKCDPNLTAMLLPLILELISITQSCDPRYHTNQLQIGTPLKLAPNWVSDL